MFSANELVRLVRDIPEQNLFAGAVGTVMIVYNKPGKPEAYEVDFSDYIIFILKTVTLYEDDIERLEIAE
jgi:hypothetical protein